MMKNIYVLLALLALLAVIYFIWPSALKPTENTQVSNSYSAIETSTTTEPTTESTISMSTSTKNFMNIITLETSKGTIVFETYNADAPKAVENFITLANKNYYDGVIFHRVINGFMIQGGDPTGTGRSGPGYTFEDELNPNSDSYKAGYVRGTVAMANSGPNTNGSQFFIMHKDTPLPNSYTIFGKVISGMEVVDEIASSEVDASDKPIETVTINKATVANK